jgi:hypothetical protein
MLVDIKERKFPFHLLESRLLSVKLFQHLISRFEVLEKRGRVGELGCHYFSCKRRKGLELKKEERKSHESENENENVLSKFKVFNFNIFSNSLPGVICFGVGRLVRIKWVWDSL